jgi:cytochrome c oxidase cbb3-type subunit 3/ubiquinol-cytochrome c reductase cytochrome c subunit
MTAWSRARGGPLDASDTDALVAFLRTWQRRPATVLDERPLNGDSARGAGQGAARSRRAHGDPRCAGAVRLADGHIAGAVSVPFYDPTPYLSSLPANAWLVCYCACPHAESGQLASHFAKVTVLDEGLWVWKAHGYPVRSGIDP